MIKQAQKEPPVPSSKINPQVSRALDAICRKAMAQRKEERYQSAMALADDVQRFVAGSRNQTSEQIRSLASVTQNLVDNKMSLENVLHISPNAIANYENIYYPEAGAVTGASCPVFRT